MACICGWVGTCDASGSEEEDWTDTCRPRRRRGDQQEAGEDEEEVREGRSKGVVLEESCDEEARFEGNQVTIARLDVCNCYGVYPEPRSRPGDAIEITETSHRQRIDELTFRRWKRGLERRSSS